MLKFCGFELELTVDSIVARRVDEPAVYSATDGAGGHWLIVAGRAAGEEMSWLCAPASPRAIEMVASGQASASDALLHSSTGWVEVVRVINGRSVPDRRVACSELAAARMISGATTA